MTTTQISVRLPERIVEYLDSLVDSGGAPSRASVIAFAVEREMRRRIYEHEARILAEEGDANGLEDLVAFTTKNLSLHGLDA